MSYMEHWGLAHRRKNMAAMDSVGTVVATDSVSRRMQCRDFGTVSCGCILSCAIKIPMTPSLFIQLKIPSISLLTGYAAIPHAFPPTYEHIPPVFTSPP